MTVEEIFKQLSSHMIHGIMFHSQQADYYDFLNLRGYKRMSEYHLFCEMKSMRKLHRYYLNHFNKLVEEDEVDNPNVIPATWYRYARQDVDTNTKCNAVKSGYESWVAWEEDTKDMYERMYKELMDIGEVAAAKLIACFVSDVDKELKCAQRKHITLKAADYSIDFILFEQDYLHDKYQRKMCEIFDHAEYDRNK